MTMWIMKWLSVGLIVLAGAKPQNAAAYTAELCSGVVLRTTPIYDTPYYGSGMDHPNDTLARAGTKVDGLVSLVVDTRTGLRRYCDLRGGACYPVDAIRLLNCSVSNQASRDGPILQYRNHSEPPCDRPDSAADERRGGDADDQVRTLPRLRRQRRLPLRQGTELALRSARARSLGG